jgi:hypothetical protein
MPNLINACTSTNFPLAMEMSRDTFSCSDTSIKQAAACVGATLSAAGPAMMCTGCLLPSLSGLAGGLVFALGWNVTCGGLGLLGHACSDSESTN